MTERPGKLDQLSETFRKVVNVNALEAAQRFNHHYIGTEHLLLGLCKDQDSQAGKVLKSLGVDTKKVEAAVEFIIGRSGRPSSNEVGLTPRSKKVIELAAGESRRRNTLEVTDLDLLTGLVREGEGIAAGVLESMGVNLEKLCAAVERAEQETPRQEEVSKPEDELLARLKVRFENPRIDQVRRQEEIGFLNHVLGLWENPNQSTTPPDNPS